MNRFGKAAEVCPVVGRSMSRVKLLMRSGG